MLLLMLFLGSNLNAKCRPRYKSCSDAPTLRWRFRRPISTFLASRAAGLTQGPRNNPSINWTSPDSAMHQRARPSKSGGKRTLPCLTFFHYGTAGDCKAVVLSGEPSDADR